MLKVDAPMNLSRTVDPDLELFHQMPYIRQEKEMPAMLPQTTGLYMKISKYVSQVFNFISLNSCRIRENFNIYFLARLAEADFC